MLNINTLSNPNLSFSSVANKILDTGAGKYYVTQRFSDNETPQHLLNYYRITVDGFYRKGHDGLDLVKANGDNTIYAFDDGVCVFADWYYNLDWIEKNQFVGGGIITMIHNKKDNYLDCYLHLSDNFGINVGDKIKRGDKIGTQGGSGSWQNEFAHHLHFQSYKVNDNCDILNRNDGFWGASPTAERFIKLNSPKKVETKEPISINNNLNINNQQKEDKSMFQQILKQIESIKKTNPNAYDNWGRAFGNTDMTKQGKEDLVWISEMVDQLNWAKNEVAIELTEKEIQLDNHEREFEEYKTNSLSTNIELSNKNTTLETETKELKKKLENCSCNLENLKPNQKLPTQKEQNLKKEQFSLNKLLIGISSISKSVCLTSVIFALSQSIIAFKPEYSDIINNQLIPLLTQFGIIGTIGEVTKLSIKEIKK